MERNKFMQQFACRLTKVMSEKGYGSGRSKTGIDINKLAEISDVSYQMARKYALGQALPEIHVIIKIANWLSVAPEVLLFNADITTSIKLKSSTTIEVDPVILKYILNKSVHLLSLSSDTDNIINFIVDAVYDAAHLDVDTRTLHRIIDMMLSSATLFKKSVQEDQKNEATQCN